MDEILKEAEKNAAPAEEKKIEPTKIELTDAQWEEEVLKRFGAKPQDLIKKEEQVVVLTEAQKKELEEKEENEMWKTALAEKWTTKPESDAYLVATKSDKVELARKKFIEQNKDLGDQAGEIFDNIFKVNEEDEVEKGDEKIPNLGKTIAMKLVAEMADEDINKRFAPVVGLKEKYKNHVAETALVTANTELVKKVFTEIPNRLEVEAGGKKYGIDLTPEDKGEIETLVLSETRKEKGLKPETVKANAIVALQVKNLPKIIEEAVRIARAQAEDETERGASGVEPDRNTQGQKVDISDAQKLVSGILKNGT